LEARPELSNAVRQNLANSSIQSSYYGRSGDLKKLHSKTYENFVRANGFGAIRMRRLHPSWIETPPLPRFKPAGIPVGEDKLAEFDSAARGWGEVLGYYMPRDLSVDGPGFHRISVVDFVHPETMGYVKSKHEVAGFVPHAFHVHPGEIASSTPDRKWQLQELQLVSLLRFPEPRVYLTENLPRMDELSAEDIETRGLDEFESNSLNSLEASQDLVLSESDDEMKMLGSIRANQSCIECHSVNYGDLLGAFSYRLRLAASDFKK
jgi:hypothetical protein